MFGLVLTHLQEPPRIRGFYSAWFWGDFFIFFTVPRMFSVSVQSISALAYKGRIASLMCDLFAFFFNAFFIAAALFESARACCPSP